MCGEQKSESGIRTRGSYISEDGSLGDGSLSSTSDTEVAQQNQPTQKPMTQVQFTRTATFKYVAKPRPKPKPSKIKPTGTDIRKVMVAGRPYPAWQRD